MKLKRFNEAAIINSTTKEMNFWKAFETYIKGKKVIDYHSVAAYGNYEMGNDRHYGDGIVVEGNYKMISHGGGCSGEDCNVSFIISPDNKVIASYNW